MPIDPKVEEPTRTLIGHAVRGELDELAGLMTTLDPQRFAECVSLCARVSGYIAIDICGHKWPSKADLREISHGMAEANMGFDLQESGVYDYLSRAALGFEPLIEVFPDEEKIATVPILATAALLVSYRTYGKHWWEYLDVIEAALEEAAQLSEAAFPAALLLSRRARALKARDATG